MNNASEIIPPSLIALFDYGSRRQMTDIRKYNGGQQDVEGVPYTGKPSVGPPPAYHYSRLSSLRTNVLESIAI